MWRNPSVEGAEVSISCLPTILDLAGRRGYRVAIPALKHELQRQLTRTRSANLEQRVKAAVYAAGPETVRQRLRRAAKEGAGQAVGGISEVWVVQDVEELSPES